MWSIKFFLLLVIFVCVAGERGGGGEGWDINKKVTKKHVYGDGNFR